MSSKWTILTKGKQRWSDVAYNFRLINQYAAAVVLLHIKSLVWDPVDWLYVSIIIHFNFDVNGINVTQKSQVKDLTAGLIESTVELTTTLLEMYITETVGLLYIQYMDTGSFGACQVVNRTPRKQLTLREWAYRSFKGNYCKNVRVFVFPRVFFFFFFFFFLRYLTCQCIFWLIGECYLEFVFFFFFVFVFF